MYHTKEVDGLDGVNGSKSFRFEQLVFFFWEEELSAQPQDIKRFASLASNGIGSLPP
jgi:hypothetical protein